MVRCMGIGGPALAVWWLRIADLLSYQLNLFTHTNSKQLNKTRAPLLWDPQSTSRDLVFVYLSTAHPQSQQKNEFIYSSLAIGLPSGDTL